VVTDTEATMIAAGRLFVSKSVEEGGTTKWISCIDQLLQLVTKKAFSDLPMSEGAPKACHNLVNYFNSSSQAMKKLLGKQVVGRAVKPVQDVYLLDSASDKDEKSLINAINLGDIDDCNPIHEGFLSETLISFDQILKTTTVAPSPSREYSISP
jgi:hypothetical protein